jgi:hypothetical protein
MKIWEKAMALLKSGKIEESDKERYRRANFKAIGVRLGQIYFIILLIVGGFGMLCFAVAAFANKPCLPVLGAFLLAALPAAIYFGVRFAGHLETIASELRNGADALKSPFHRR